MNVKFHTREQKARIRVAYDIDYASKMIRNFFSNKHEKFSLSLISVHFI